MQDDETSNYLPGPDSALWKLGPLGLLAIFIWLQMYQPEVRAQDQPQHIVTDSTQTSHGHHSGPRSIFGSPKPFELETSVQAAFGDHSGESLTGKLSNHIMAQSGYSTSTVTGTAVSRQQISQQACAYFQHLFSSIITPTFWI